MDKNNIMPILYRSLYVEYFPSSIKTGSIKGNVPSTNNPSSSSSSSPFVFSVASPLSQSSLCSI